MMQPRVLLIEDNAGDARLIENYLHRCRQDYRIDVVKNMGEGIEKLRRETYDAILSDLSLPDCDGLLSIYKIRDAAPQVPLVVLTGNQDQSMAVMAVREGAQEYLIKDNINPGMLERVLTYSMARHGQITNLQHMAYHDMLTGLPNRMMFMHTLAHDMDIAVRNNHAIAVHFLDFDNFKGVNDTHGHDCGDVFLQEAANRLGRSLRASDLLARFGGDEFVILQNLTLTTDNVVTFAEKLMKLFETPLMCEGKEIMTGISVGIAMFPEHSSVPEELVTKADKALYTAKNNGKRCYRFYTDN